MLFETFNAGHGCCSLSTRHQPSILHDVTAEPISITSMFQSRSSMTQFQADYPFDISPEDQSNCTRVHVSTPWSRLYPFNPLFAALIPSYPIPSVRWFSVQIQITSYQTNASDLTLHTQIKASPRWSYGFPLDFLDASSSTTLTVDFFLLLVCYRAITLCLPPRPLAPCKNTPASDSTLRQYSLTPMRRS